MLAEMARTDTLPKRLPTLAEVANFAAFVASDRASAMTGAIAKLTCGSLGYLLRAIFLSFPSSLSVLVSFDWPSIDWKSERTVFFTGGVTNGS